MATKDAIQIYKDLERCCHPHVVRMNYIPKSKSTVSSAMRPICLIFVCVCVIYEHKSEQHFILYTLGWSRRPRSAANAYHTLAQLAMRTRPDQKARSDSKFGCPTCCVELLSN
eukprot:3692099-Amphidinium_carterae.1